MEENGGICERHHKQQSMPAKLKNIQNQVKSFHLLDHTDPMEEYSRTVSTFAYSMSYIFGKLMVQVIVMVKTIEVMKQCNISNTT